MIELDPHSDGVILPVRAQPGASRSEIKGEQDGALKAAITQIAEKGKANKALIALLAERLKLRKSQLTLLSGESSPQKRFLVVGISPANLKQKIADSLVT